MVEHYKLGRSGKSFYRKIDFVKFVKKEAGLVGLAFGLRRIRIGLLFLFAFLRHVCADHPQKCRCGNGKKYRNKRQQHNVPCKSPGGFFRVQKHSFSVKLATADSNVLVLPEISGRFGQRGPLENIGSFRIRLPICNFQAPDVVL